MTTRTAQLGTARLPFPSAALSQMVDSAPLLNAPEPAAALRAVLARDGFLLLRGVLDAADVLAARAHVLAHLSAAGGILEPGGDGSVLLDACGLGCLPNMEGRNSLTHAAPVGAVLEGTRLRGIMELLLGEPARTFDYKWLRGVPRAVFTGAHCDSVYMARGSQQLHTVWIPLEPLASVELGSLAVLAGSHRLPGFARLQETYGKLDTEAEPGFEGTGWFTSDPLELSALDAGSQWQTADFGPGDVVIFGMRTLHMSTANQTDRVRLSCDVRWQPAAHAVDERYVGTTSEMAEKQAQRKRGGAWAAGAGDAAQGGARVSIDDLRQRWGV